MHQYSTFGPVCQYLHKISTIDRCDNSKVIFRTFGLNCYDCVNNGPKWADLGLTRRIMALRAEHKRQVPDGAGDGKGPTMASTKQNAITRQSGTARKSILANTITDNTNIDLIPTTPEFVALRNATIRVNQAIAMGRAASMVMCAELAKVRDELNALRDLNAKNANKGKMDNYDIRAYAEEMFGLKKSQAYSYAKVGARFFNEDGTLKSEYVDTLQGVSPSVLGLLVDMTDEEVFDMGASVDRMTAANIRAYRRELKAANKPAPSLSERSESTTDTTDTTDNTDTTDTTDTITFEEPTYGLHVQMEIRDDVVEILLGDGDKQRRRVYHRINDRKAILVDIASFLQ